VTPAPIKAVWKPLPGSQTLAMACPADVILYHGTRGPGKGFPLDEIIYTPTGPKAVGTLRCGDLVIRPEGGYSTIVGVFPQGIRQTYQIVFEDGSTAVCDDQHLWYIHVQGSRIDRVMGMGEILKRFRTYAARLHIPTTLPVEFEGKTLPIDPYLLGLLLGDGSFTQSGSFCTTDNEIADYVMLHGFREWKSDSRTVNHVVRNFGFPDNIRQQLWALGLRGKLSHEKYIPNIYLHASVQQRLALLQGLMDTDGTVDRCGGWVDFGSSSKELSRGVQELAWSLGGRASLKSSRTVVNGKTHKDCWRVYIQPGNKFPVFRLKRKLEKTKPYQWDTLWRRIVDVKELDKVETICIKVDNPSGLIVTRDYVVTHNTDAQLMRFRRRVGQGYGKFWRGVIFDRQYKNLDDLVSKSMRWFPEFKDGARFLSSKSDYRWVWPTGEELMFRAIQRDNDYWSYHGQEFPFLGWNELTKYPTDSLFDMMMSCNRSSFRPEDYPVTIDGDIYEKTGQIVFVPYDYKNAREFLLPEIPLEVFATCNPYGAGHNWVKKRFIDAAPMGKLVRKTRNVFNPQTKEKEDVVVTQTHIFGSYRENKYLSPKYIAEMDAMTDKNKREAWLKGNWDITAGGMFDDIWDRLHHVVKPFPIPKTWRIDRSFDWGSSKPFSVGWWAESDGSDYVDAHGRIRSSVRGDLFRIGEWYGCTGKPNQGLQMLAIEVAKGIVEREILAGYIGRVQPGPADGSIFDVENGNSIAADMSKHVRIDGKLYYGVQWGRADKSPGSRIAGWEKVRKYLKSALPNADGGPRENPGVFIFDTCANCINLLPTIPRDEDKPDDVDTDAEDHIADEVRYRILSTGVGGTIGKTQGT